MKNTIYKKIFYSFSVIIILYTALILFVFISKELSRQKYESSVEVEFYLEREAARIDSQIETAIDSTQMLAENDVIQRLSYAKKTDYALYSEVFDQMKENLFSGYQLGYNLGITQGAGEMVIGLNGYFAFDDYLSFIGITKDNQEAEDFFSSNDRYQTRIISVNQNLYLLRKSYRIGDQSPLYFIVNWDKNRLRGQEISNIDGKLYFHDSLAADGQDTGGADNTAPFLPLDSTVKNGIGHGQTKNEAGFWKYSAIVPTLAYLYIVPQSALGYIPTDSIILILTVLFGLLLLGSLLTIYFSRTNYRPYRKIITEIQSGDMDTADIEEIIKKIEDLKNSKADFGRFQEANLEDIREVFFKNVLVGKYTPVEIKRIVPIIGLEPLEQGGLIVILTIKGRSADEENLGDRELLKARQRIIEYSTDTKNIHLYVQPIDSSKFALTYSSKNQDIVLGRIEKLRNLLANDLHVSSQFVLSVPFESLNEFASTFRDVFSLNSESIFKTEQIIVNRSLDKGVNYVYSVEAEQRLVHLVKSRKIEEATALIEGILRTNCVEKRLGTQAVEDLKQALVNTLKRIIQIAGADYSDFYFNNQDIFDRLVSTDTKVLYRLFLSLFQESFSVAGKVPEESHDVMDRVLEYIDGNYKEDLSLSDLADQFRLTESYLSRMVKEGTGITFKNYLNQLKVNHAKQLLEEGKLMVSEVAEAVGVKNVNTFIRMFKQYEGVTPGRYQTYGKDGGGKT
ncbi:helix-turn-helix transcriptional regulator [Candidatus Enterococcus leclercqii]|uniref:helix-turn-helix transcriptional regulator n=1 Tax=Candidatus Enterococcus leclercqii TaxID=1857218 RepID=UPI00137ADF60|nr:AraC family transcriptional regulator [Enterococcus sp. CU9D]KAF1290737.1 hypothetical protein BAU14_08120 [Enterococcus sp. CU9D]